MATILLVEDHNLVRAGIRALLERSHCGHEIVAEAANGRAAAGLARDLRPDLAVIDVSMPEINGIETVRLVRKSSPSTAAMMLSMHPDSAFVHAALQAGAMGYVLKDAAFAELTAAIATVLAGRKYLSPQVAEALRQGGPPGWGPASPALERLSRRERQILQMIGEAFSSKEIAEKLGLRPRTIESYRQNMMDKLGLHSVAALTSFALRHGLCDPRMNAS